MRKISLLSRIFDPVTIPWYASECIPVLPNQIGRKWDLGDSIYRFTSHPDDKWTLSEALRGLQIFGATGSGKSTGSGRAIAKSFLEAGMGGLVLCVKVDEAAFWETLCKETGRSADFIRITPDGPHCYNFLQAEAMQPSGQMTLNISELFFEVMALLNRSTGTSVKDPFWQDNVEKLINHAIVINYAALGVISIEQLTRLILAASNAYDPPAGLSSSARKNAVTTLKEFKTSAISRQPNNQELRKAIEYFELEFAGLAEKTRSIIVASFTAIADPLLRPPLTRLLCDSTNCRPEDVFQGKIIVVDVPVHSHHKVGRITNLIWKTAFKRACQRRKDPDRPVFLWIDESQYLVDEIDVRFQTTARSARCCTVFLTQNLPNYIVELGGRDQVDSLLGSLHTKIFHQNGEHQTNEYASKTIGRLPLPRSSTSQKHSGIFSFELQHRTVSTSTEWDFDVPSRLFTNLMSGGIENGLRVDAIVHIPGKRFSSRKTWLQSTFLQQ